MKGLVILGKIELPKPPIKVRALYCDDCGGPVNSGFGDPRDIVTTTYADGSKDIRRICEDCSRMWDEDYDLGRSILIIR